MSGRTESSLLLGRAACEVYRAHDARLNREVALKILRPEFATDADRLQRFVREAQTLAALNHTHIWWFPSGQRLAYGEVGSVGMNRLTASNADGSGGRHELARGLHPVISPDGRAIVYGIEDRGEPQLRYSVVSPDGTVGPPEQLFKTSDPVIHGVRFSPDGQYLAYVERQPGGAMELFVTRFPSGEGRWQVSSGGGRGPVWAVTGELFFASGSNDGPKTLMAVTTKSAPSLTLGTPIKLFDVGPDIEISPRGGSFDVTADAKRFVMVRSRRSAGAPSSVRWVLAQNGLREFGSR